MKTILRYDQGEVGNVEITDEGFLKATPIVTRLGVLIYKNPDGTLRRELRHPNDILRSDSLDTMKMIPITNDHPAERTVDNRTAKQFQVGYTGENVHPDGLFIKVPIVITDSVAVVDVQNGKDNLSLGYKVDLVKENGEYDGHRYDFRQTNVRYNHLAIVNSARAGSEVRINMDSEDAIHIEEDETHKDAVLTYKRRQALPDSAFCFVRGRGENKVRKFPAHDAAHVRNGLSRLPQSNISPADKARTLACLKRKAKQYDIEVGDNQDNSSSFDDYNLDSNELTLISKKGGGNMDLPVIRIDNIDYEASQEVINAYTKSVGRVDELEKSVKTITDEKEALQAKVDTAEEELKTLKEHDVNKDVADAVKVRLDLERTAEKILDEKERENLDSMNNVDIKKAIIVKKFPDSKEKLDAEDVTDVYIDARFDSVVESIDSGGSTIADQRQKAAPRNDGSHTDSVEDARAKMIERQENLYKFDRKDEDK